MSRMPIGPGGPTKVAALLPFVLLACSGLPKGPPYKVYVTDRDSSAVTVILPRTGFPARRIRVGREPTYVTATHKGGMVLVADTGDSTVSFISTARDSIVAELRVGGLLKGIEVDPEDRYALVADEANASVAVIDLAQRRVIRRIAVDPEPHNFAFDSSSGRAFVACAGANAVDIIDLARLEEIGSIPAGFQPHNLVFFRGQLAVTSRNQPLVYFSDSTGVFDSVRVGTGPHGIAADREGRMLYVSGAGSDTVTMIDATNRRVVSAARVGPGPYGIRVSPHDLFVFLACSGADEVAVSTVHAMNATAVKAPGSPFWIAIARQPVAGTGAKAAAAN
jgi:YVTN family beta-propeller protein